MFNINLPLMFLEPDDDVLEALHLFGFDTFRPGQKEAIMRILCGLYFVTVMMFLSISLSENRHTHTNTHTYRHTH